MTRLLSVLFLLILQLAFVTANQMDIPLTAEDAIIMQELEWVEKAMEGYKQKKGNMPIRSPIRGAHIHSEDWRQESIQLLSQGSKDFEEHEALSNLRGRQQR